MQRFFTGGIPSLARFSYPERFELLNVQSLELRRIRGDCMMLHKMLNNHVNISFDRFFTLRSSVSQRTLPRNNAISIFIPRAHLDLYMHSFSIRSAHYWNALSDDVVRIVSVYSFVHCLPNLVLQSFVRGRT